MQHQTILAVVLIAAALMPSAGYAQRQARPYPNDYKRVHQEGLRLLLQGKTDKAVAMMNAFLADHPDDAESHYILALAAKDPEAIKQHVAAALERGLPPGRFWAQPFERMVPERLRPAGRDDRQLPGAKVTLPENKPAKFTIAFGGGAGYDPRFERMWTTIGSFKPTALLMLGDNVYHDDPTSEAMQRYCYYRRQSRPEWRKLVGSTPTYAIWDDHDFGTNDCWGGPEIDSPAWKRKVWEVFKEQWANPYYGGGEKQPGVWFDFHIADVHFIMLDGRYYRTDPKIENPSMLGPVQKAWLLDKLKHSKATFKVIASPVPWTFESKGDSLDTWNGYRAERGEIFDLIRDEKIGGVVLLSADRHRTDMWKIAREKPAYDLYEFSSSRLTNQHVHPELPHALHSYNTKQSFGLVDFDTTEADPSVTFTTISIDGEKIHSMTIRRSELSSK